MKYWDDDKLLSEYELISNYIKRLIQEKEQLKSARKYKKQLQIELELRGLI